MNTHKWYWGYNDQDTTFLFHSLEEARDHAVGQGIFDEITGKDAMMAFEEELFFEISISELEEVQPYQIIEEKL